jgi:exonuclease III
MRNVIGIAFLAFGVMTGNVYAAGTDVCPKVSEIKSSAYTSDDKNIPAPFNEGYKYTSTANGKTWTGVTMATKDNYLDKKYNLKAESFDGSICSYGGTKVVENGETAVPYLKLKAS